MKLAGKLFEETVQLNEVSSMVDRFAFYGAGGFARETFQGFLRSQGVTRSGEIELFFIDDDEELQGGDVHGYRVISYDEAKTIRGLKVNITFANPEFRRKKIERCECDNIALFSSFAPTSIIGPGVEIGPGAIFSHNTIVTSDAEIGKAFHCNIYSYVAHDCIVGDYVTFAPRVSLNGRIKVEDGVYIGTNATFLPGEVNRFLTVGAGAIIGAGAVVTKDVEPGTVMIGMPAKPKRW